MFKRILVAVDGSDASQSAFTAALDLARTHGGELHLCSVIEDLPSYAEAVMDEVDERLEETERHFKEIQRPLLERATAQGVTAIPTIVAGHPVEAIIGLAEHGHIDCIVIGKLGQSRILHRASGGTGTQIAYHAPCSILIVQH